MKNTEYNKTRLCKSDDTFEFSMDFDILLKVF